MLPLHDRKILIVDDEVELRDMFAQEFSYAGATVSTAQNGADALDSIRKNNYDIIFSDIKMPVLDGINLVKRIKSENLDVKVCVLISGFSEYSLQDAYDAGASGLYTKPTDFETLLTELQRLVQPLAERLKPTRFSLGDTFATKINVIKYPMEKANRIVNISQGGMFISAGSEFPRVGEVVNFSVRFTGPGTIYSNFTGFGICRWVRRNSDASGAAGYGVEFIELADDSISFLNELIRNFNSGAYIPKS